MVSRGHCYVGRGQRSEAWQAGAVQKVRGLGKGHFLTIAVDIVVARNAEDFFARDGGRRRQFIEERDSKFVLGGLSRVGDVTGREDKVENRAGLAPPDDVIAHSRKHSVLRPGMVYPQVEIRNM